MEEGFTYEQGLILGVAHVAFHPIDEDPVQFAGWLGQILGGVPVSGKSSRMVGVTGQGQIEILLQQDFPHIAIRVTDMERAKTHFAQWGIEFDPPKLDNDERKVVFFKEPRGGMRFHLLWEKGFAAS
jgi:hypothetical protein